MARPHVRTVGGRTSLAHRQWRGLYKDNGALISTDRVLFYAARKYAACAQAAGDASYGLDADGSGTLDRDEFGGLVQATGLVLWRRDLLLDVFDQMVHPKALDMLMTPCTVFYILCIIRIF